MCANVGMSESMFIACLRALLVTGLGRASLSGFRNDVVCSCMACAYAFCKYPEHKPWNLFGAEIVKRYQP